MKEFCIYSCMALCGFRQGPFAGNIDEREYGLEYMVEPTKNHVDL